MSDPKAGMQNTAAIAAAAETIAETAAELSAETTAGAVADASSDAVVKTAVNTAEAADESGGKETGNPDSPGCCCGERKKVRSEKEHRDLINRLNRIEGQIRGIKGMIERDAYCIDVLNQASAASSALSGFCKVLLSSHIRSCVAEDVRQGNEEKMEELVKTLQKMMR